MRMRQAGDEGRPAVLRERRMKLGLSIGAAFAAMLWLGLSGAQAQKPVKLLLVLVGSAGVHDVEKTPPYLEEAIRKVGGIEVTKLAPPVGKQGDGAHLAKLAAIRPGDADVIAFYTVGQRLAPEQEAALTNFVEQGGGLVAIHGA